MQYAWDPRCTFDMATLPKAVAGELKLADALRLRVLLWLACVGQGRFDAASCAVTCGTTPEACEEALEYWRGRGMVILETEAAKVSAPSLSADAVSVPVLVPTAASEPTVAEATEPLIQTVSPAATRPSRAQVLEVHASDERFAFLLETAASKLGKVLSPADMSVYLYLYREIGLPPEVILMIIGYAVKNGKARLSYIEKTALNWAESGITTIAAADAHLCRLEHLTQAWAQVNEWGALAIERPSTAQKEAACRWVYDWEMPREVIEVAIAYTNEKLGKFQAAYTDRVLEKWHQLGIHTAQAAKDDLHTAAKPAAKKKTSRMKTAKEREPSFDIGEYESLALRHRPRPPQKEG